MTGDATGDVKGSLEEAWALLAADPPASGEFSSRAIGVAISTGQVQAALDASGGLHLLLPVEDVLQVRSDTRSRGVQLVSMETRGGEESFADLHCPDPDLKEVFVRLAAEVVEGICELGVDPVGEAHRVLARWRELLERRGSGRLSVAKERGLFGELLLLNRVIEQDPARRLDSWVGPSAGPRDFRAGDVAVEVKTTGSVDGRRVEIHGLEQLDDLEGVDLLVAWYRILEDPSGDSISDLVRSLNDAGVDAADLAALLQLVGWMQPEEDEIERRYVLREQALYRVGEEFPRIIRSTLTEATRAAVESVSYVLDLAAVEPVPEPEWARVIHALATGAVA